MKRTVYIFGDPEQEHLRAEIGDGEIILISHELRLSQASLNQWRDRVLAAMPVDAWQAVASLSGDAGTTAAGTGIVVEGGRTC